LFVQCHRQGFLIGNGHCQFPWWLWWWWQFDAPHLWVEGIVLH
jgi:hypothetical protein